MDKAEPRQRPPQPHAHQIWQDHCRICKVDGKLLALPYIEASRLDDYELGATLAAISANRLLRRLLKSAT